MISRIATSYAGAIVFVLVVAGAVVAQERAATGSVAGKVTVKNKGVAGVVVFAEEQNPRVWTGTNYRGTTDETGNYRITNLPAATCVIRPMAPAFALEDEVTNNSVVVAEGENVEGINFSLVPGGVITGKVTDADGKPLIEQNVFVFPSDSHTPDDGRWIGSLHTDDRGIYRAFGLRQGKYKVSVGREDTLPGGPRASYRRTFYPSVTDIRKATVVEVTAGSEATNIDIVVGRPVSTFKISGRIVDAETEKPLSGINYGIYQGRENGGSSMVGRDYSNANGEFRFENVLPGNYVVFIAPGETGVRGDSVSFEVVDHDVSDLVIKAGKAASLSGVVVFEGSEEAAAKLKLSELFINAWVENSDQYFGGNSPHQINRDGSFSVGGLRAGPIRFEFSSRLRGDRKPIELVRVERDGIALSRDLILKDGEQVTGLRLFVKSLTGAIQGQIKVEGDEVIPNSRLSIWLTLLDDNRTWYQSTSAPPTPELDARKHFAVQNVPAGTYVVNVAVYDSGRYDTNRIYRQEVTVTDNAVSEVTVTIKAKP